MVLVEIHAFNISKPIRLNREIPIRHNLQYHSSNLIMTTTDHPKELGIVLESGKISRTGCIYIHGIFMQNVGQAKFFIFRVIR